MREVRLLRLLNENDPNNKQHIIKFFETFSLKNHLCIVFEELEYILRLIFCSMNLRNLLRIETKGRGLNISATCLYVAQITRALKYLHSLGYIHADLKPDNILITSNRTSVKLCDFGSAVASYEVGITEELASRFYRPPEASV